jgi:hypothetical protein
MIACATDSAPASQALRAGGKFTEQSTKTGILSVEDLTDADVHAVRHPGPCYQELLDVHKGLASAMCLTVFPR